MSTETRTVPAVPAVAPSLRLEPAPPAEPGGTPRTRALLSLGPAWKSPVDITGDLVGALAHALWRSRGGLDVENWVDAERLLRSLLPAGIIEAKPATPETSAPARPTASATVASPAPRAPAPPARRGKGR